MEVIYSFYENAILELLSDFTVPFIATLIAYVFYSKIKIRVIAVFLLLFGATFFIKSIVGFYKMYDDREMYCVEGKVRSIRKPRTVSFDVRNMTFTYGSSSGSFGFRDMDFKFDTSKIYSFYYKKDSKYRESIFKVVEFDHSSSESLDRGL